MTATAWNPGGPFVPPVTADQIAVKPATAGGLVNAITIAITPSIAAHSINKGFAFDAVGINTGPVTVAVSGLPAVAVTKLGIVPLTGGEINAGVNIIIWNGLSYELINVNILSTANSWSGKQTFTGGTSTAPTTSVAVANVTNLSALAGQSVLLTGTDSVSAITLLSGQVVFAEVVDGFTLAHSASLKLNNNGNNVVLVAGDRIVLVGETGAITYAIVSKLSGQQVAPIVLPTFGAQVTVRQTVLSGPVISVGATAVPNFLPATSGSLALTSQNISSTSPLALTSAAGVSALTGNTLDSSGVSVANLTWNPLVASVRNYMYGDISNNLLTPGFTPLAPQYSYGYDRSQNSILHCEGTNGGTIFLDDYGNAWTSGNGATTSTTQTKIGATSGSFSAASNQRLTTPDITSLGGDSWCAEGYVYPTTVPGAGNRRIFWCLQNAVGAFGMSVGQDNTGGVQKFFVELSSNGTTNDISAAVGTATPALNAWTHVALVYDAITATYYLYINGVVDITVASALIVASGTGMALGGNFFSNIRNFNGFIDEFRLTKSFVRYPVGIAFVPYTTARAVEGNWFNIAQMVMNEATGASTATSSNPVFTQRSRVFVGEAVGGASTITSTVAYAYNGQYDSGFISPLPPAGSVIPLNSNIGTARSTSNLVIRNSISEGGYAVGEELDGVETAYNAAGFSQNILISRTRNATTFIIGNSATPYYGLNKASGGSFNPTPANWSYALRVKRAF